MLQIVTGMYFREGAEVHRTLHRAVFYSNGATLSSDPVELPGGRLLFSTGLRGVGTATVEADEQLEKNDTNGQPSLLISTGGAELLDDLVAVVAFALNVSFSRNQGLISRLVPSSLSPRPSDRASAILARTFDPEVFLTPEDLAQAREFLIRLLPLNRPYFDAALRAIRRVVDATYLVSDDPTMAYTMFVAALESLSQLVEFPDDHDWSRYDSKKAKIIDPALDGLTDEQADPIRDAVLTIDHLSLRRRFTAFTLDHVRPSFYREEAVNARQPIRAVDLPRALDFAYQLRSKNVHALQTLAPELWVVADRAETLPVNKIRALGLEGLNRLTRHMIRTFVDRAPTHLDESFRYRDHLPNIVRMRFAPEMWIGRPDAMSRDTAPEVLEGFLSMLMPVLGDRKDAQLVDMRPVLERVEELVRGENKRSVRVPMVALYELWHSVLAPEHHRPDAETFLAKYLPDLDDPSLYAFVRVLIGHPIEWTTDQVLDLLSERRRTLTGHPDRQLPTRLDAALTLAGAQKAWDIARDQAVTLVAAAVEILPGDAKLIDLENAVRGGDLPDLDLRDFVTEGGVWGASQPKRPSGPIPRAQTRVPIQHQLLQPRRRTPHLNRQSLWRQRWHSLSHRRSPRSGISDPMRGLKLQPPTSATGPVTEGRPCGCGASAHVGLDRGSERCTWILSFASNTSRCPPAPPSRLIFRVRLEELRHADESCLVAGGAGIQAVRERLGQGSCRRPGSI